MPEIRSVSPQHPHRSPSRPTQTAQPRQASPRPGAEIVDVFARLLPGVVVTPATFRSETALAGQLRVDARRIRDLRMAGLVTPTRLGRGWVYGPGDVRTLSVMLALLRLGASVHEIESFFTTTRTIAVDGRSAPSPVRLCIGFCERLAGRMEEEITRLGALDALLCETSGEISPTSETSQKPL